MGADLPSIIHHLTSLADDFPAEARDRAHTRAAIAELLTTDYPAVGSELRSAITAAVMRVLEEDDFFGIEFVGDPFSDPDAEPDE